MPHSSGGGSHGGGSHGGSHGGSSGRTSHHYFPGARRYRRHHPNGTDEYFYSNRTPQKTTLASIVVVGVFGAFFVLMFGVTSLASRPHQLKENYSRPSHYVNDSIDVIEDEKELEDALEEFNDLTGICPVIYTYYEEDCKGSSSLEDYTMSEYTGNFHDERHFVIVYTIPEDQAEMAAEGNGFIPDYAWEAVQGDDTDPILTESVFMDFADYVQEKLEDGKDPGEAFTGGFEKVLTPRAEKKLNGSSFSVLSLMPVVFIILFFSIPLYSMIKTYRRDKDAVIEEVPLSEDDIASGAGISSTSIGAGADPSKLKNVGMVGSVISALIILPFVLVGIATIAGGAVAVKQNVDSGLFILGFGILWTAISLIIFVSIIRTFRKVMMQKDTPLTAEYPVSKPVTSEYPEMQQPAADLNRFDDFDMPQSTSSYTREEDEEYERMRRKGYE